MPGSRALNRLDRVIRHLEAGAPLNGARLARALRINRLLWQALVAERFGQPCSSTVPDAALAPLLFGLAPDAARDPESWRRWYDAQAALFLHYAPVAGRLLGPTSLPGERAAALLIPDALHLVAGHAAAFGDRDHADGGLELPQIPFARLLHHGSELRSHRSADVNLGAVALALAIESGFRHALGLAPEDRFSAWRLFHALSRTEARLAVDLPVLVAVYNWASRHRSAGRRGFGWLNYYAADLLHPLFEPVGAAFGLEASPEVLARLRDAATGRLWVGENAASDVLNLENNPDSGAPLSDPEPVFTALRSRGFPVPDLRFADEIHTSR